MDFNSVDLIGPFKMTASVNKNTVTMIWMLTHYVICIPLKDKSVDTEVIAYLREVYCQIGGSRNILSDNGSELKKLIFRSSHSAGNETFILIPIWIPSKWLDRNFS